MNTNIYQGEDKTIYLQVFQGAIPIDFANNASDVELVLFVGIKPVAKFKYDNPTFPFGKINFDTNDATLLIFELNSQLTKDFPPGALHCYVEMTNSTTNKKSIHTAEIGRVVKNLML